MKLTSRLYALGIVGIVCVLLFYVKESNYFAEENVIAPIAVEQKMAELESEEAAQR